jgi:hypothetical protein
MGFLDHCTLIVKSDSGDKFAYRDLRYIHGRSEVLKGEHDVTSVLLAQLRTDVKMTDQDWLPKLPDLYKNFLASLK